MTPVSALSDAEVTRELIDLADRAGPDERRVLAFAIYCAPKPAVSHHEIRELYAALPPDEQRLQLTLARRVVTLGMAQYGPLDLPRDRRDFAAEAVAEDVDGVVYRLADVLRGARADRLLVDGIDLMRRSVAAALRRGAI